MYCNNCNQKVPTGSKFCNFCGKRILVEKKRDSLYEPITPKISEPSYINVEKPITANRIMKKEEELKSIAKKEWKPIIITYSVISLILLLIIGLLVGLPYMKYVEAKSKLEAKEYNEAISEFEKMLGYKDSEQLRKEAIYRKGLALIEEESYQFAIQILTEIEDYRDVSERIMESKYLEIKKYYDEGYYRYSIDAFSEIMNYRDASELVKEAKYQIALEEIDKNNYEESRTMLEDIIDYKDAEDLLKMSYIEEAIYAYEEGHFKEARTLFEGLKDYEHVETYLSNIDLIESFHGVWGGYIGRTYSEWVIEGWYVRRGDAPASSDTRKGYIKDGKLISGFTFSIVGGKLIQEASNGTFTYDRQSYTTYRPEVKQDEPKIGMTPNEVKASTWGSPEKINRTVTEYGISEQWVYPTYRYIYFEDGLVTTIQY